MKSENNLDENGNKVLKSFFNKHYNVLLSYARSHLGGRYHDAEEVISNVSLNLFARGKVNLYNPCRELRPWLYIVVNNACKDYQDKERRHSRGLRLDENPSEDTPEKSPLKDILEDYSAEDPREISLKQEEREIINLAISELPKDLQEVVRPYYFGGIKYKEVAGMLEIPLGTVKSKLHRAKEILRESLSPRLLLYPDSEKYNAVA